jgi:hypothetical protein
VQTGSGVVIRVRLRSLAVPGWGGCCAEVPAIADSQNLANPAAEVGSARFDVVFDRGTPAGGGYRRSHQT